MVPLGPWLGRSPCFYQVSYRQFHRALCSGTVQADTANDNFQPVVCTISAGQPSEVLERWAERMLNGISQGESLCERAPLRYQ